MALGQIVDLVMVNKDVKYDVHILSRVEVMVFCLFAFSLGLFFEHWTPGLGLFFLRSP